MTKTALTIVSVIVALAGIPVGIALTDTTYKGVASIIIGIVLGFILIGLFILLVFNQNAKTVYKKIAALIIGLGGIVSGLMIGYRHGATPALPWRWYSGYSWAQVVVGSYIEWVATIVPCLILIALGITLFCQSIKGRKSVT